MKALTTSFERDNILRKNKDTIEVFAPSSPMRGAGGGNPSSPFKSPGKNWRRPEDTLYGYSGHYKVEEKPHVLDQPLKKVVIRGYSGFLPQTRQICGSPSIPSEKQQLDMEKTRSGRALTARLTAEDEAPLDSAAQSTAFRHYAKGMDVCERYESAVERLQARGQTQTILLRMVQAKFSERVKSYAEQLIGVRRLFESFDFNQDGVLDESEFRECLEQCNIQFDDTQVLALFAFFDEDLAGVISWERFAAHATVLNPRGGSAVLPKQIIASYTARDMEEIKAKGPF